jgi:hypothetical protein
MSTSVAYLTKRLRDIGRHDLLRAIECNELSTYAAAEAAGIVKRRPVTGNGSENQSKTRAWAVARATGKVPPLPPRPEKPAPPTQPKFSQETRAVIARLVEAGRTDLVLAVAERRISPVAASRLLDGRRRRKGRPQKLPRISEAISETKQEPKKPAEVSFDPATLIA